MAINNRSALWISAVAVIFGGAMLRAETPPEKEPVLSSEDRAIAIRTTAESDTTYADTAGKMSIHAKDVPLTSILELISQKSGYNIKAVKESVGALKITVDLQDVHWREILNFVALTSKLNVDYSNEKNGIILVDKPPQITYNFTQAQVKDVITIIARQADANIIMDDQITGTITMRLRDIPWRAALDLVIKSAPQDLAILDDASNKILRIVQAKKVKEESETRIFRLSYIQPMGKNYSAAIPGVTIKDTSATANILEVLKLIATTDVGKIAVDGRSNSLIIKDTPVQLDTMQKIIMELDIAPKQIHIAVRIVELTDTDAENLGIRWEAGIGDGTGAGFGIEQTYPSAVPTGFPFMFGGREKLTDTVLSQYALSGSRGVDVNANGALDATDFVYNARTVRANANNPLYRDFPSITGPQDTITMGKLSFNAGSKLVLEMIRRKAQSSIIQSPDLITLDNEGSVIEVGTLLRFAEQTTQTTEGGGTSSGFQEARSSPISTGVTLTLIPHVTGPDNNIMLTILPKMEELVQMRNYTGPDGTQLSLPETTNTTMVTTMLMRNKETVVVGGLKRVTNTTDTYTVPFLGDLPVIGWLFRSKNTNNVTKNVYVFVTPTIIDFNDRQRFERDLERIRAEFSKPFVLKGENTR